jgi:hypothetical protein
MLLSKRFLIDSYVWLILEGAMSEDQFTKLFTYMEKRFDEMNQRFAKVDSQFDQVYTLIDEVLKNQETEAQKRLVIARQLDRHEEWVNRASQQVGVRYER